MADNPRDRQDPGGTGVPQFAGALEGSTEKRLGDELGYGANPYEVVAMHSLIDQITRGLMQVTMTLNGDPKNKYREVIDEAVVCIGAPRELVILAASAVAMVKMATQFGTQPPDPRDLDHISRDTLRRFRAHIWDMVDMANRFQRFELDRVRREELRWRGM